MNNELEGKKTTYKNIEDLIAKGKEKIDELTKEQDELSRNLLFESGKLDAQRQQNKERLALLEIEQEEKKKEMLDRMRAEYATDAGKIVEELNQVKRSLSEERAKIKAANTARKLAEKERADLDYHRVCVPVANLNDIEKLKNLALELTVSDILVTDRKSESYQAFIDTVVEEVKKKTKQNPYSVPMEIYTNMDAKK